MTKQEIVAELKVIERRAGGLVEAIDPPVTEKTKAQVVLDPWIGIILAAAATIATIAAINGEASGGAATCGTLLGFWAGMALREHYVSKQRWRAMRRAAREGLRERGKE